MNGDPLVTQTPNRGSKRYKDPSGYIFIYAPGHPMAKSDGYIAEHRKIMADHLGRALLRNENVHHINGIRDDNRIENLELWVINQPSGQRVADQVAWAKEILSTHSPESLR